MKRNRLILLLIIFIVSLTLFSCFMFKKVKPQITDIKIYDSNGNLLVGEYKELYRDDLYNYKTNLDYQNDDYNMLYLNSPEPNYPIYVVEAEKGEEYTIVITIQSKEKIDKLELADSPNYGYDEKIVIDVDSVEDKNYTFKYTITDLTETIMWVKHRLFYKDEVVYFSHIDGSTYGFMLLVKDNYDTKFNY